MDLTIENPTSKGLSVQQKEERNVCFENANMAICTLLFCPHFMFTHCSLLPSSSIYSPFQLSPTSNSFSPGLILMWLQCLSSPSAHFFPLFSSSSSSFPHPLLSSSCSLSFLKNLPLMKLNSLVGSFLGLCVRACLGVCGYVSWPNWLEWRSKAVSKSSVCVRACVLTSKRKTALWIASQELIKPSEKKAVTHLHTSPEHMYLSSFLSLLYCSRLTKWKCQMFFMSIL